MVHVSGSGSIPPIFTISCMNPILVMSVSRQIISVGDGRDDNLIELVRASGHDRISERQQAKLSFYLFYSLFSFAYSRSVDNIQHLQNYLATISCYVLCGIVKMNVFFSLQLLLGTSVLRLLDVTVITGTHIPDPSTNQKQPFVIPPKNSSRTLAPTEVPPTTARRQAPFNPRRASQIPPNRPTTHPRLGTSLHSRYPNPGISPPTETCPIGLPTGVLNLDLPRESQAAQTDSSPSPSSTTLGQSDYRHIHTSTRDRSPRCCRRQQPGASPERRPPAAHPPSSPTQHPASPRRRQRQQQHR